VLDESLPHGYSGRDYKLVPSGGAGYRAIHPWGSCV
jgi:hypothetical protein